MRFRPKIFLMLKLSRKDRNTEVAPIVVKFLDASSVFLVMGSLKELRYGIGCFLKRFSIKVKKKMHEKMKMT